MTHLDIDNVDSHCRLSVESLAPQVRKEVCALIHDELDRIRQLSMPEDLQRNWEALQKEMHSTAPVAAQQRGLSAGVIPSGRTVPRPVAEPPAPRKALHASAVITGARGFWLAQLAAQRQRTGGVAYQPDTNEAFPDLDYADSWPDHHEH